MDSVTQENVEKIMKDRDNAQHELEVLKNTTEQQMWLKELDAFQEQYLIYKTQREKIQSETTTQKRKAGASTGGGKKVPKQVKK